MLSVQVWDKSNISPVEKAIRFLFEKLITTEHFLNVFLENGARTQKIRVYEMTDNFRCRGASLELEESVWVDGQAQPVACEASATTSIAAASASAALTNVPRSRPSA